MASPISSNNSATLLTLPLDLLKKITNRLAPRDEKALKLTCKRMNLLIVPPPLHHHLNHLNLQQHHRNNNNNEAANANAAHGGSGGNHNNDGDDDDDDEEDNHSNFLTVGVSRDLIPRDGRATPIPQSPLPFKAAATLQELELENREVEEREVERGMELSDDDAASAVSGVSSRVSGNANRRTKKKYKVKKNILHWTAELDSAPNSPGGPGGPGGPAGAAGGFVHSPRATGSSSPALPTFTLTIQ